jgi:hypothetical protein
VKKYFIILILFLAGIAAYSQDENDDKGGGKIRDRMVEYIQDRLGLSRNESEKFTPVFLKYFQEFRQIRQQNKDDKLILNKKSLTCAFATGVNSGRSWMSQELIKSSFMKMNFEERLFRF